MLRRPPLKLIHDKSWREGGRAARSETKGHAKMRERTARHYMFSTNEFMCRGCRTIEALPGLQKEKKTENWYLVFE